MRFFKKILKIIAAFILVGLICCIPLYILVFKVLPEKDPDNQFNRATILQVLSGETRVFYNDGEELLGAFFDANHRVYVSYGDIPINIVNALVAAEDATYWNHNGFSFHGFFRAMASNLKSGHMRQGGSTLTQQTVKNIFGREERSIKEKGKELLNALRMEKHFSKEEILEFYLNQFHVSGTGKGVAIAAQYFFNKDLKDLTLAECAFIAGSVKGPYNYDPFIQRNEERRDRALARGVERLNYVLSRMVEEGYIEQEEMNKALEKPLEFKHGDFRFTMSTTLDRLEERLDNDFFKELFEQEGIEDWRRAQLEITTTLDAKSQDAAKRALQNNISNLQLQLGGFVLPKAQFANKALKARKGEYLYGAVDSVFYDAQGKLNSLKLSFGQLKGIVTENSVRDFAKQVGGDVNKILAAQLKPGSILLVSVLDDKLLNGYASCKIETEPVLQGGLIALQNGKVLASQGGFHNTGFDRNFKALRQLGSSWKPILYALALKYHWNYLDELENEFNVFQYGSQFYYPRPDHTNKGDVVSIAWAATRSENIASIWLLEHLLDKVSLDEFKEIAALNNFAQRDGEALSDYGNRLRDSLSLHMKDEVRREIQFTRARDLLAEQYKIEGKVAKARAVMNLRYGTFTETGIKQAKKSETTLKYLKHNYKNYSEVLRARNVQELDPDVADTLPSLDDVELFPEFTLADFKRLTTMVEPVHSEDNYLDIAYLRFWPDFRRALAMAEFARFSKEIGIHQKMKKVFSMPLGVNEVTLAEISTAYQSILTGKVFKCKDGEWGEPCFIKEIKNRDGRVIFTNEIESKEVLDDIVTSQMAVMLRSVFTHGTARSQFQEIVVKSPDRTSKLRYPAMGKTGTTNDYRNVAFMGAIPTYVDEKKNVALDSVIAIGSYVGFDNNKPLKSGTTRIAGASGGLPQWASFAKEEVELLGVAKKIDFLDIPTIAAGEVSILLEKERGQLFVDPMTGLPLGGEKKSEGRSLPWLDVPGFIPPQVQERAAANAAEMGMVTSLSMPILPETDSSAVDSLTNNEALQLEDRPVPESAETTLSSESSVPPRSATPAPSAMPKDADWDLPTGVESKNAFVPLEAEIE